VPTVTRDGRASGTLRLLEQHHPEGADEAAQLRQMTQLLASTPEPFSREQFDPGHFTASALVVSPSARLVLLIAHPTLGLWLQPGGHIEPGDPSPLDAAFREVMEETGLAPRLEPILFDVDVHDIPARKADPAHRHFDLRFLALVEGAPEPAGAEGLESRWLHIAEAARLTTDASVRRMLDKARAQGLV
jgi:8-oxo-dGTP pyrophosphatase MutT (NUDIX family)